MMPADDEMMPVDDGDSDYDGDPEDREQASPDWSCPRFYDRWEGTRRDDDYPPTDDEEDEVDREWAEYVGVTDEFSERHRYDGRLNDGSYNEGYSEWYWENADSDGVVE